jgi:hypothetical protein
METPQSPEAAAPVWEKLGMSQQEFYDMPVSWRLAQGEAHQPSVQREQRRPVQDYTPTAEQQAELDAITNRDARVTRYRQLRDAQQQP